MPLQESFERSGNWLFKYRSFLPLVLYLFALPVIIITPENFLSFRSMGWSALCLGVSMVGQVIRAWAIGHTPAGTSGRNTQEQVAETVNSTGIYSMVRHPLYIGNYFMWLGIILYTGNFWFVIVCSLAFWLYYERIMFAEEQFLRRKFGQTYLNWAEKTPAFIPRFSNYQKSQLPFSLRNVLKREYNGFFAVFISFALVDILKNYFLLDKFWLSLKWQIALGLSFLIFITLRSLKKYTRVLEVQGR